MITAIVVAVAVSCVVSVLVINVMAKKCINVMDKYVDDVMKMMGNTFSEVIAMISKRK